MKVKRRESNAAMAKRVLEGTENDEAVMKRALEGKFPSSAPKELVLCRGYKLKPKVPRLACETFESTFFVFLFILILADIDVVAPEFHHAINEQGQFVRSCCDALGFS